MLTHDQNQPKSLPAQTHGMAGIMQETLTINIGHLADSAYFKGVY